MGIVTHGICRSCNRTSPLTDLDNDWCDRCANDPNYRDTLNKYSIIRYAAILTYFTIVLFVMGYCK